jgi:RHS repeat-associated protein
MTRTIWSLLVTALLLPTPALAQPEEVVYYHLDAVGSVRMTTTPTGSVIARYDFLPFGEAWVPPANPDTRQYAGKERDAETGLDYFGARYYASQTGRFTTIDPVLDQQKALFDPQQWNRYAYARNNALRYIDPDGAEITTPASFFTRAFEQQNADNLRALGKVLINTGRSINSPGHMTAEAEARFFEQPDNVAEASRMRFFDFALTAAPALLSLRATPTRLTSVGEEIGILRDAARGRGNHGLGMATAADAGRLGRAWVGEGFKVASDGTTLISRDGLRQYRPPTYKPNQKRFQANFEQRPSPNGAWTSNGHLDIFF